MVIKGEKKVGKKREGGVWLMALPVWMVWVLVVGLWDENESLSRDESGVRFLVWWMLCMLSFGIVSGFAIYVGVC